MNDDEIKEKVKNALEESKKRSFVQTIDVSIVLKNIDFSKNQVRDIYVLPNGIGKDRKICALVDKSLHTSAKKYCDGVILSEDFDDYKGDKKKIKKLCDEYDLFLSQASIMPKVATVFGKVFGPRNKMPNPKAGSVVSSDTDLKSVVQRLKKIVFLRARKQPVINFPAGNEKMSLEEISENINSVLKFLENRLEKGKNNIKSVFVKTTMGPSIKIM